LKPTPSAQGLVVARASWSITHGPLPRALGAAFGPARRLAIQRSTREKRRAEPDSQPLCSHDW
jgi:hypothetical protein